MASVIGWLLVLLPLVWKIAVKAFPALFRLIGKIGGKGKTFVGPVPTTIASAFKFGGILSGIMMILSKMWGWMSRLPGWLKILFGTGGLLWPIRWILNFIVMGFKKPVLVVISLVVSSIFPTILEKIFLVFGAVTLKIFLLFFRLGKAAFLGAMSSGGSGTGTGTVDNLRQMLLGSFDELPDCMVRAMGYVHLIEDLGIYMSTITLLVILSVFRLVYHRR